MTFGDNTLSFVFDEPGAHAHKAHPLGGPPPPPPPPPPGRPTAAPDNRPPFHGGGAPLRRRGQGYGGYYPGHRGGGTDTRSRLGPLVQGNTATAAVTGPPPGGATGPCPGVGAEAADTPAGSTGRSSAQVRAIPLKYNVFRHSWSTRWHGEVSWPASSAAACWWCCHGFDSVPVPLPTKYCQKLDAFNVTGNFCSWSCARSYANTTRQALQASELLSLLRYKLNGTFVSTKLAPPRHCLSMFGGAMTIDEFRAASDYPNRQVMAVHIQQQPFGVRTKPSSSSSPHDVATYQEDQHRCAAGPQQASQACLASGDASSGGGGSNGGGGSDGGGAGISARNGGARTGAGQQGSRAGGTDPGSAGGGKELSFNNISNKKNEPLKLKRTKPVAKNKTVLEKVLGLTFTPVNHT